MLPIGRFSDKPVIPRGEETLKNLWMGFLNLI